MDIIGDLKDTMGQLVNSVDKGGQVRSTIDGIRRQLAEADRKRQIRNIQAELDKLKPQVDQAILSLGLQALSMYEAGRLNNPEIAALCQHVVELRAEIAKLEAELAQLQPPPPPQAVVGTPCVSCGRPVPAGAAFCPSCGTKVELAPTPEARFCQHCGAALRPGAKFCPNCGQGVPAP